MNTHPQPQAQTTPESSPFRGVVGVPHTPLNAQGQWPALRELPRRQRKKARKAIQRAANAKARGKPKAAHVV